MSHLPREIFNLVTESLNKVRLKKKIHRDFRENKHLNEKLISKWEINIKEYFKQNPLYLEIKYPLINDWCI